MDIVVRVVTLLQKLICGGSGDGPLPPPQPYPQPHPTQGQQYQPQQPFRPPQGPPAAFQEEQPPPQEQAHLQHHKPHHGHHKQEHNNGTDTPGTHIPPHHSPSPPTGHHGHQNQNLVNQENPHYTSLRDRAHKEGEAMARCFDQSHAAYQNGDGARAHELSEEGHRHQREMEKLDGEASDWIFRENNLDSAPGEIDLHGLYVHEAVVRTDRAIQEAQSRGDSSIKLIVGKGLHSKGHAAKIKPAIEELMVKHHFSAHLDPHNEGVLIVDFAGERGRGLNADEVMRRLERQDGDCTIM